MKMASSKVFLLCGLLLVALVFMAAQVSARDLAEEIQSQESVKEANYGYGGGHGSYGHGGEGYGGGGRGEGGRGEGGRGGGGRGEGGRGEGGRGGGGRGEGGRGGGGRGEGGRGGGGRGGHPPEKTEDVKN